MQTLILCGLELESVFKRNHWFHFIEFSSAHLSRKKIDFTAGKRWNKSK